MSGHNHPQFAIAAQIAQMGTSLGPDILTQCTALFDGEHRKAASRMPPLDADIAYGPHERHVLDIYTPRGNGPWPVLVFVHGGGFLKGDKGDTERWPNAAVGRLAAERGFLGVVINYRLAPESVWPAGSEDVATVVDWLTGNAAQYGGDPENIALMGTSAGAVHVAGYLKLQPDHAGAVRAGVLLSGLYGFTALDERDTLYYGEPALYPDRMPMAATAETLLPLFAACAEFDPPRFQAEFLGLMQSRLARHGVLPCGYIASGHNHYSMAMHLGTSDARLADEIFSFLRKVMVS
jgi:acetyl esterase/lipase